MVHNVEDLALLLMHNRCAAAALPPPCFRLRLRGCRLSMLTPPPLRLLRLAASTPRRLRTT